MPIYEYVCDKCEAEFEELILKAGEEESLACPSCGALAVTRRMSRPAACGGCGGDSEGASLGSGGGCGGGCAGGCCGCG